MTVLEAGNGSVAVSCRGARKSDGAPCRSRDVGKDGWCPFHRPDGGFDPAVMGRNGGIASGEARREAGKTVRERLRERVEEDVERIWSAFEVALDSEDERTRVAAAVAVLAEAYGRPPQALIGDPDQPVAFTIVSAFADRRDGGSA
jgi:hypothetical protein